MFIDYSPHHQGYQCLHLASNRVFVSLHVLFNENTFPFSETSLSSPPSSSSFPIASFNSVSLVVTNSTASSPPTLLHDLPTLSPSSSPTSPTLDLSASSSSLSEPHISRHPMVTRMADNTRKSKLFPNHVTYNTTHHPLSISSPTEIEPTCFSQAHKHACWRTAMVEEYNALIQNGTWSLVPPSSKHNIVGSKWVF